MIITCEECSTKFNLDESILKKEGSKVRCTICRHIFTAYPHVEPSPPETALPTPSAAGTLHESEPRKQEQTAEPSPQPRDTVSPKPTNKLEFEEEAVPAMEEEFEEEINFEEELSADFASGDSSAQSEDDLAIDFSLEEELDVNTASSESPEPTLDDEMALDPSMNEEMLLPDADSADSIGMEEVTDLDLDDFSLDGEDDFSDNDTQAEFADSETGTGLDMDFQLEDDVDFSDGDAPAGEGDIEGPSSDIDLTGFSMDDEAAASEIETTRNPETPVKEETDLNLDLDFSMDDETAESGSKPIQDPDSQLEEGTELELDLDFSMDDEAASSDGKTAQMPDTQLEEGSELELDMDFSLDDGAATDSDSDQNLELQLEEGTELELDFSLDDEAATDSELDQSLELQLEEGTELDMDFSLDDGAATDSESDQSLELQLEEGTELDMDFSLDDEAATDSDSDQSLELQLEEGTELDLDFSMDDESSPTNASDSRETALADGDDLDLDFSMDEPISDSQGPGLEDGQDLDLDFSSDDTHPANGDHDIEETLELELEGDADLDLDFSIMENAMEAKETEPDASDEEELQLESSTAMDLDYSMNDDLNEESDTFDPKASEDLFNAETDETVIMESDTTSDDQASRLEETATEESTLSGERPHLMYENEQMGKDRSFGIGRLIVMLLFLVIVCIVGYAGAIMTGFKIPGISDLNIPYIADFKKLPYIEQFFPPPAPEPVKLTPVKKTVTSQFLINSTSGTLFAIKGEVLNQSKIPCKNVKLQGTLISNEKEKIKTTFALCGNTIPEENLKTMDIAAINGRLTHSDNNSDFIVNPGKTIPFLLVFSDFPDNIETFIMTVTDFERMPLKKQK